jgi:tetrahydromethanopterin S-methyltransferase subunit H
LFGNVDAPVGDGSQGVIHAGDAVKMVDLKDHLKHARKVAQCMKVSSCCFKVLYGTNELKIIIFPLVKLTLQCSFYI